METTPIAVLLSGRSSNFLALHHAIERGELPARIVLVASNLEAAAGLVEDPLDQLMRQRRELPDDLVDAHAVGKIHEAEIRPRGLWVKAQIIKTAPEVWTMIGEGILKAPRLSPTSSGSRR